MNRLIIIGASGHGKVVADIARLSSYEDIVFLDNDKNIKFTAGTEDIDVYIVLTGEEVKLPTESTVYMVVAHSVPDGSSDPTSYAKKVTVPVNSDVAFNYYPFFYAPWNKNIDAKYEVYWWHAKSDHSAWNLYLQK